MRDRLSRSIQNARSAVLLSLSVAAIACGAATPITRDFGGRYEQGREIPADAYAAALRGAVAEAGGDFRLAKREYARAAKLFPDDPELTTRVAAASCSLKPDPMDLEDATKAHPNYAPAWLALARCYDRTEQAGAAKAARTKAAELAPGTPGLGLDAFVEATFLRDNAASYYAVALQAAAADDAALEVWAFGRVAELAPSRRADVAQAATNLLLAGRVVDARSLATKLVDLGMRQEGASRLPQNLGRLSVDEALLRDDASLAMARANATRISLAEASLRAHALGRFATSKTLFELVLATDPDSGDAKLASMLQGDVKLGPDMPPTLRLSRFGRLVLASAILPWGAESASRVLGERKGDVDDVEDPLTRRLLVRLAAAGAVQGSQVMLDTLAEAKVRAGEDVPEGLLHWPLLERVRLILRGSKAVLRNAEIAQEPLAAFAWCKLHGKEDMPRLREVVGLHPSDALVINCALTSGLTDAHLRARAASLSQR